MQKYGTSPAVVVVHSYELPAITRLELNTSPGVSSVAAPEVNVCAAVSVLENNTFPPTSTVASFGMKHPSTVSSHPGVPDPGVGIIVTFVCSANTSLMEITLIRTTSVNKNRIFFNTLLLT